MLAAGSAPAATAPPPPAPGVAPGSVAVGNLPSTTLLVYTAADGSVWLHNLSGSSSQLTAHIESFLTRNFPSLGGTDAH